MRRVLVLALGLFSCTPETLRDRPDGMLAPFPADASGREVPYEQMVPRLIEQSVQLTVRPAPVPPAVARAGDLVDLRNEPVLVLGPGGAVGLWAPWPLERTWTLRPPTRDELRAVPLGSLGAHTRAAGWKAALDWVRQQAEVPRPEVQRFTGSVLVVADGGTKASDARAIASVLESLGAARKVRIAVRRADGLWAALPLPPASVPVSALQEIAGAAAPRAAVAPEHVSPAAVPAVPEDPTDPRARLARVLAEPIPGPRCIEVSVKNEAEVAAAVKSALGTAGPQDVVAIRGIDPTLDLYLHPERLVGDALAPRVRLGDACE